MALLVTSAALAQPAAPAGAAAPADARTEEARRHFKNGVKLFQDGHYAGALAEFEAAYALKPGAASLKNVALSQKALYRYAEAADTLRKVLTQHGAELTEDERRVVQQAIDELASLVGSIVLRVSPPSAKVTLDGRPVDAAQWSEGIHLNVGEHTVAAEAPGYAKVNRTIRVAGGQKNVPVDLALQPVAGFVTVVALDADAAIAVDGAAKAFGKWSGPLSPGRHYVQVYRQGYKTFEQKLWVELGRTVQIDAPALEALPPDEVPDPKTGELPSRQLRGWYGLVALTALGMRDAPDGLDVDESDVTGGSFGVRAGYRLWTPIAVEMLLEVKPLSDEDAADPNAAKAAPPGKAKGWDPYFLLEVGAQFNWGHILMEANVTAFIDGASNATGDGYDPFEDTGGLVMVGLGLRGGWSEWTPADAPR